MSRFSRKFNHLFFGSAGIFAGSGRRNLRQAPPAVHAMLLALWLLGAALSAAPCTAAACGLLPQSEGIVRLATAFAAAPHLRSHSRRSCEPVMMAKKGKSAKGKPPPVSKGFGAAKDPPLIEMGRRLAKNMGKGGSSSLNPKVCNDEWLQQWFGVLFCTAAVSPARVPSCFHFPTPLSPCVRSPSSAMLPLLLLPCHRAMIPRAPLKYSCCSAELV